MMGTTHLIEVIPLKSKYIFFLIMLIVTANVNAKEQKLSEFLTHFDYEARIEMKVGASGLVGLLQNGKAELIDIRFKEEYEA